MSVLAQGKSWLTGTASIEDLASAELLDWFVWDNLVMAAYERADCNRQEAMRLLARAVSRLAEADDGSLAGDSSGADPITN